MKRLVTLLSLGMILSLASCGDDEDQGPDYSGWDTDVSTLELILDLNGLSQVPVARFARYATVNGEQRFTQILFDGDSLPSPLDTIPPEIGNMTALEKLNIRGNTVRSLPDAIGSLRALRIVIATNNSLSTLPEAIYSLPNLTTLTVDSNQIGVLSASVGAAPSLQSLNVSSNSLTTLPTELTGASTLLNIMFADNQICTLPPDMVTWLGQFGYGSNWVTATAQRCTP